MSVGALIHAQTLHVTQYTRYSSWGTNAEHNFSVFEHFERSSFFEHFAIFEHLTGRQTFIDHVAIKTRKPKDSSIIKRACIILPSEW